MECLNTHTLDNAHPDAHLCLDPFHLNKSQMLKLDVLAKTL